MRESLWTLNNFLSGGHDCVATLFKDDMLIEQIIILAQSKNIDILTEALFIICTVIQSNQTEYIQILAKNNIIHILCTGFQLKS